MSDIDVLLDRLGEYPTTLSGLADRARELATGATAVTSTTGRQDSAAAAAGLAEHLGALLGDVGTALDEDASKVGTTQQTLLDTENLISSALKELL